MRILHLEDSTADHALVRLTLRRSGVAHEIRQVETLDEFTQWVMQKNHDLILADYRLPGFTALDAWSVVEKQAGHPPFVLLSGAIGEAAAVDAMRLGFADYLLKDDMARLPHVLQRALEVAEARRAREQAAAELAESEQRLADLAEHLQTSIEEERAAIAREIHDDIGGALAAVKFDLVVAYRTAQEALTNISKHAQATKVSVELACDADFLTLEVRDDGCGISATAREKSKAFGLRGLAERARTVGGWLDISSQPGAGTSIIVSLPLAGSDCQGDELDPRCTV
jgi:signal transduction histidine kinase